MFKENHRPSHNAGPAAQTTNARCRCDVEWIQLWEADRDGIPQQSRRRGTKDRHAFMERRYGLCAAENILGDEKYMVGDDEKYMVRDEKYMVGDEKYMVRDEKYMVGDDEKCTRMQPQE